MLSTSFNYKKNDLEKSVPERIFFIIIKISNAQTNNLYQIYNFFTRNRIDMVILLLMFPGANF